MSGTVWLNGAYVAGDVASTSVFDGGFLHGAGLFETMRAENERVFRMDAHFSRLERSAGRLLAPIERGQLPRAEHLSELLRRNGLADGRIRVTATAGKMTGTVEAVAPELTVCATVSPLSDHPAAHYERGIAVIVSGYRQSPLDPTAGHKTTCYLPRLLGLREARQARCAEAIWFTTHHHLAEGCISNVFVVRDGTLKTPPLDTPVLPGLARELVLQLARDASIETEECVLSIDDLLDADEVFLTNSIMQVMPVIRVEKKDIAEGRVGEITRRLYQRYRATVQRECCLE